MRDFEGREDIELVVASFYDKALKDDVIGYFFTEIVPLNLKTHIPLISDFWENILFDATKYQRNAMGKHFEIHQLSPIKPTHFNRWFSLWEQTINENFAGEKAELAKMRAKSIAGVMSAKMNG